MIKTSHTILSIDENPTVPELLKIVGDCRYNIEIEHAISPETGLEHLKCINTPSLIWSNNNFANSDIDGREFLKKCKKISPLSSRILCGTKLSENDIAPLINSGEIQSSYISPVLYMVNPILSSIQIGIEHHKINLLEHFLNSLNVNSVTRLKKILTRNSNIEKNIGWMFGLKRDWVDFENRDLELTQLSKRTNSVLKKIPKLSSYLVGVNNALSGIEEEGKATLKKIQDHIVFIEGFLTHSKKHLKNSLNHVTKTNIHITKTKDKIKRLKDEFM